MIRNALLTILMAAEISVAAEFVGTSPCGASVREFIGISKTEPCDKITWLLNLSPNSNTFTLTATYAFRNKAPLDLSIVEK